ncbi:TBC1 domain family member 25 [Trichinella nativa]|uniref:non-specific serine/threonine protein kinase n=1 Tax=Trichinella nativa TaxID=6335 RepID=A0A0V1LBM1_9BILA|nr:TBC1 domain family member 25 [Trichinella nativa]
MIIEKSTLRQTKKSLHMSLHWFSINEMTGQLQAGLRKNPWNCRQISADFASSESIFWCFAYVCIQDCRRHFCAFIVGNSVLFSTEYMRYGELLLNNCIPTWAKYYICYLSKSSFLKMNDSPMTFIYQLPFRSMEILVNCLDVDNGWEEVAGMLNFTFQEVCFLRQARSRHNSPSAEMLQILSGRGVSLKILKEALQQVGNFRALELLDSSNLTSEDKTPHKPLLNPVNENRNLLFTAYDNQHPMESNTVEEKPVSANHSAVMSVPGALRASYEEIVQATDNFSASNLLGHGGYGMVYKGIWKNTVVAVKKLVLDNCTGKQQQPLHNHAAVQQLLKELQALTLLRHDNILSLYGYCFDHMVPYLVYQYMANGSLEDRLHNKSENKLLTWMERLKILLGTCRGLNFLHTCSDQPVIHGDVKSANILLDQHLEPKIGDFGLCRVGKLRDGVDEHPFIVSHIKGTLAYLPPEFISKKLVSSKLDVYSFGTVCLKNTVHFDASRSVRWVLGTVLQETKDLFVSYDQLNNEHLRDVVKEVFSIKSDFVISYLISDDDDLDDWEILDCDEVLAVDQSFGKNCAGGRLNVNSAFGAALIKLFQPSSRKSCAYSWSLSKTPLTLAKYNEYLDSEGRIILLSQFRLRIFQGGCEPRLRRIVWPILLGVFPAGLTSAQRHACMLQLRRVYFHLRHSWYQRLPKVRAEMRWMMNSIRKDVIRTDREHPFYAGDEWNNAGLTSLFNILTTYALFHPQVSYCQGMGDLVSPLLVVLGDEALAYVCFCAMMKRLSRNFAFDGQAMANKFHDLAQLIHYYDEKFSAYLTEVHANDLLFCYRWLLLDLKREFKFDHSLIVMEVIWASTLSPPVQEQVELFDRQLAIFCRLNTVRDKKMITGSNRSSCSHASKWKIINCRPAHLAADSTVLRMQLNCWKNSHTSKTIQNFSPKYSHTCSACEFFATAVLQLPTAVFNFGINSDFDSVALADLHMPVCSPADLQCNTNELTVDDGQYWLDNSQWKNACTMSVQFAEEVWSSESDNDEERDQLDDVVEGNCCCQLTLGRIQEMLYKLDFPKENSEFLSTNNGSLSSSTSSSSVLSCADAPSHHHTSNQDCLKETENCGSNDVNQKLSSDKPFLIFICMTLILQHRNLIMRKRMDINDMTMFFDNQMKHYNVKKILRLARRRFADYFEDDFCN